MKSKLADLASIAEIIAAVGVILSLLFVGFQIRDGNRETRAATTQSVLDSEIAFQAEMLRYSDTWQKISSGAPLSDETETRVGILLFNMMMTTYENRYLQAESGYLEDPPYLEVAISIPFYEVWRRSGGATARARRFMEVMDDLWINSPCSARQSNTTRTESSYECLGEMPTRSGEDLFP